MSDKRLRVWIEAGFPEQVALWLAAMAKGKRSGEPYIGKADRLVKYSGESFENSERMRKAWATIENAASKHHPDAVVSIFSLLPDKPERAPFQLLYGKRAIDPGEERARYSELLECVKAIEKLISPNGPHLMNMLRDSQATTDAHTACIAYRGVEDGLYTALPKLRRLLDLIDPTAKIPTKHWMADDADVKNYVILVAALNRYLEKPQHAALAVLANASCPDTPITADQLRKAWSRGADKRA